MSKQDFSFFHELRVRWAEVDLQKIVFNGHYLTYFDVAFTEYWRATKLPDAMQQHHEGKELFARKTTIEYHAPATFDDVLDIGVRAARFGRSSMQMVVEIFRGEELLVSGELNYVYADTSIRKGVPVPEEWKAVMADMETLKPEAAKP